jgi:hypothetical protein
MKPATTIECEPLAAEDADMLARHLADETEAQREVLRRLADQERLLARHDIRSLERNLLESDPILARLQTLMQTRIRIMTLLGKRLGVAPEAVSMSQVAARVGPEARDRLVRAAAELRKVLEDVARHTGRVNVMLRYAADTDRALLDALLGGQSPLRPYGQDGRRQASSALPRFAREF